MPEPLPFCKIKLQYLLEMAADPELDDNAFRVAAYLALRHADHQTGGSYAAFKTIGDAIGKCAKSVKRALSKPGLAHYLEVERGTNLGKASRYLPSREALIRASERRREADKIVPLSRSKGGQNCPERGTGVSAKGGRNRPPNSESKLRSRTGDGGLEFVPSLSRGVQDWEDFSQQFFGERLAIVLGEDQRDGVLGYWLPGKWPPTNHDDWPEMALLLQSTRRTPRAEVVNG